MIYKLLTINLTVFSITAAIASNTPDLIDPMHSAGEALAPPPLDEGTRLALERFQRRTEKPETASYRELRDEKSIQESLNRSFGHGEEAGSSEERPPELKGYSNLQSALESNN